MEAELHTFLKSLREEGKRVMFTPRALYHLYLSIRNLNSRDLQGAEFYKFNQLGPAPNFTFKWSPLAALTDRVRTVFVPNLQLKPAWTEDLACANDFWLGPTDSPDV